MRPRDLGEFLGQQHLLGPGGVLREAIQADLIESFVVWGPPGSGKTSLARIIARATSMRFVSCSAAVAGAAWFQKLARQTHRHAHDHGGRTLLFVDEAHRLAPRAQDFLIPLLEEGTLVLAAATAVAPPAVLSPALLSRAVAYEFVRLSEDELRVLLTRVLEDAERGLGAADLVLEPAAEDCLVAHARGDARILLNALDRLALLARSSADAAIGIERVLEVTRGPAASYQGGDDNHYDVATAFVKSMRGSDADAAMYWLARLLAAGEDPAFIASRIVIAAAEDVGLADPLALIVAENAARALERIGMPHGRAILAEAALYVATAPKSNAASMGLERTLYEVRRRPRHGVPLHLRHRTLRGAPDAGYGQGGAYPQQLSSQFIFRQYLPDALQGEIFYEPGDEGTEARIRERLRQWWPERRR